MWFFNWANKESSATGSQQEGPVCCPGSEFDDGNFGQKQCPTPISSVAAADIFTATVGEPEPLNSTITLSEYDPAWPASFAQRAADIRQVLGDRCCQLEHVGSTSVPGLAAKPVIDMLLVVPNSAHEADYVPPLQALAYILRIREPDWYEHRVLKPADKSANLHVFTTGCPEIERMLTFRDWLRTHPADRQRYEAVKRRLAQQSWQYMQNYADAKSTVVQEIMQRASGRAH